MAKPSGRREASDRQRDEGERPGQANRRQREAKHLTLRRVIAESVLYPVNGILQGLFRAPSRREGLCQASGGGSPRRCAKKALHCSQNPVEAVRGFGRYIEANQSFILNYGDRYRHGEAISTAFAESAVNQVVSNRMVKKQQMQRSEAASAPFTAGADEGAQPGASRGLRSLVSRDAHRTGIEPGEEGCVAPGLKCPPSCATNAEATGKWPRVAQRLGEPHGALIFFSFDIERAYG